MSTGLHYYARRKSILNGVPQTIVDKTGNQRQMERQYHLFCANACDGDDYPFDLDAIEWGTLEGGAIERKKYEKAAPEPEPTE